MSQYDTSNITLNQTENMPMHYPALFLANHAQQLGAKISKALEMAVEISILYEI